MVWIRCYAEIDEKEINALFGGSKIKNMKESDIFCQTFSATQNTM